MTNNPRQIREHRCDNKLASLRLAGVRIKGLFFSIFALLILLAPTTILAKRDVTKVTIKGPGITLPIEITDPEIVKNFQVWMGLGTSSNEEVGFIVNWSQGIVAERPSGLHRYEVSVYAKCPQERLIYVVFYEYDPLMEQGYVYLPGKDDERYRLNVSTIYRGVEGSWFRAWRAWENVARPLIAKAKQT
jgi:hypothetical protein